jgi:hypothetical protein
VEGGAGGERGCWVGGWVGQVSVGGGAGGGELAGVFAGDVCVGMCCLTDVMQLQLQACSMLSGDD